MKLPSSRGIDMTAVSGTLLQEQPEVSKEKEENETRADDPTSDQHPAKRQKLGMDTSATDGSADFVLTTLVKPAPLPRPVEHSVGTAAPTEASTNRDPSAVAESERAANKSREERDWLGGTPDCSEGTTDTAQTEAKDVSAICLPGIETAGTSKIVEHTKPSAREQDGAAREHLKRKKPETGEARVAENDRFEDDNVEHVLDFKIDDTPPGSMGVAYRVVKEDLSQEDDWAKLALKPYQGSYKEGDLVHVQFNHEQPNPARIVELRQGKQVFFIVQWLYSQQLAEDWLRDSKSNGICAHDTADLLAGWPFNAKAQFLWSDHFQVVMEANLAGHVTARPDISTEVYLETDLTTFRAFRWDRTKRTKERQDRNRLKATRQQPTSKKGAKNSKESAPVVQTAAVSLLSRLSVLENLLKTQKQARTLQA